MRRLQYVMLAILLAYTVLLAYWMLFGFGRAPQPSFGYNLKPFMTIKHFLTTSNQASASINLLGNIAVFIPFGLLLPMAGLRRATKAYGVFLSGLILLELAQLISRRGSFDVDDLLLNSLGFWIGYACYYYIIQRISRNKGWWNNDDDRAVT